jgi:L-iditol 2-dehydrogenase
VLVVGAGPIGAMHALLARACGAAKTYIRDISVSRMKECASLIPGCQIVEGDDLEAAINGLTGGKGVDFCITACPAPQAQVDALKVCGMNGRILYFGGLPAGKDAVTLNTNLIHYKQLSIHGSTRGNVAQYRDVAKMAAAGNLNLQSLISRKYPLADFAQAVDYTRSAVGLKTVIEF